MGVTVERAVQPAEPAVAVAAAGAVGVAGQRAGVASVGSAASLGPGCGRVAQSSLSAARLILLVVVAELVAQQLEEQHSAVPAEQAEAAGTDPRTPASVLAS